MLYAEDKERLDFVYTIYHWWQAIAIFIVYLWSNMPMRVCVCVCLKYSTSKKRLTIVFAYFFLSSPIFVPLRQAKLSILLATLLLACYCYWVMERRLAVRLPFRLPRIPRPRHKVTNHTAREESVLV